jgi:hypothetical protein
MGAKTVVRRLQYHRAIDFQQRLPFLVCFLYVLGQQLMDAQVSRLLV